MGSATNILNIAHIKKKNECDQCRKSAEERGIPICSTPGDSFGCPLFHQYYEIELKDPSMNTEPPIGNGYQMWEFTSEGSPQRPVFPSLSELCEWCEKKATIYARAKATKEQWLEVFKKTSMLVEKKGITISLPMADEDLYFFDPENRLDLFSLRKTARCRYMGLVTEKLPALVSVREMNMLAFIYNRIQFFRSLIKHSGTNFRYAAMGNISTFDTTS